MAFGWLKKILKVARSPIVDRIYETLDQLLELVEVGIKAAEDDELTIIEAVSIFRELSDVIEAFRGSNDKN